MSFTGDMNKFCKKEAPTKLESVARKIVIEIGNRLVFRSPVGNPKLWKGPAPAGYVGGRFRANWQYGFGVMSGGELDARDKSGRVTIARINGDVKRHPAAGVHFLYNNLPYAQRLENRWSTQAPKGMVSLTELEFPAIVREANA